MTPHQRLVLLARRQNHIWTREQARACGFSDSKVDRLVAEGAWRRWFGGPVFSAGAGAVPWLTELSAARARVGVDAVVGRRSAARLWGMPGFEESTAREFVVPREHTPRIRGLRVARTIHLPERSIVDHSNLRVTSPARTLHDLAPVVRDDETLLVAAAEMMRLRRLGPMGLVAETVARPRLPGNPRTRRVAERLDPRYARTRSVAEIFGLIRLADLGYDDVRVNVRRTLSNGREVELDVLIGERIDLEIHSDQFHGTVVQQRADAARRRDLEADGYICGELWATELDDHDRVAAVVEDLLARARLPR